MYALNSRVGDSARPQIASARSRSTMTSLWGFGSLILINEAQHERTIGPVRNRLCLVFVCFLSPSHSKLGVLQARME